VQNGYAALFLDISVLAMHSGLPYGPIEVLAASRPS
jgi:hypothetical protein